MFDLLAKVIDPVKSLISEYITDADQRAAAHERLEEIRIDAERDASRERIAQIDVNREQAKHASMFVAGARAFAMWAFTIIVCLPIAIAYAIYLIAATTAIIAWVGAGTGNIQDILPALPDVDTAHILAALMGLLGLNWARSWEKGKGVARNYIGGRAS